MDSFLNKLAELKSLMKSGRFDNRLVTKAGILEDVMEHQKDEVARDIINYLKAKCMIAEVLDYFGQTERAQRLLEPEGNTNLEELQRFSKESGRQNPRVIRDRIQFCLVHAQVNLYREHSYGHFISRVLLCKEIMRKISNSKFPCWGTQANIAYQMARGYRQTNEFDQAEKYFAESINLHYERAEQKWDKYEQGGYTYEECQEDISHARYRSAISLGLGLGWVNFTKGLLTSALRNNIIPARVMLAHSGDQINKAYLDIIFGAIKRCLAGNNSKELESVIKLINKSLSVFSSIGHDRYRARSAYELSLAHLYLSYIFKKEQNSSKRKENINNAREMAQEVLRISEAMKDWRWVSNAYIIQSRIERWDEKYLEAERLASRALETAEENEQILCMIDARLARGKARFKLNSFEDAQTDFEEAKSLNRLSTSPRSSNLPEPRNPRIQAVCNLNLARIYVQKKDERQARDYLAQAKSRLRNIEHVIIHSFADAVEKAIEGLKPDFIIKVEDVFKRGRGYRYYDKKLKAFLIYQAGKNNESEGEIAQKLKVTRKTVREWKRKATKKPRNIVHRAR